MIRWMRDAVSRCTSAGHEWLASDDPEACPDCMGWALATAHRAGQEAMRERAATLCEDWEEDSYCEGWREMEQGAQHCADAIRALEVSHD